MNKSIIKVLAALIAIVAVVVGLNKYGRYEKEKVEKDIELNRSEIKSLENRDLAELEAKLKNFRKENGINRQKIDTVSNKRYFEDSVFMGDSLMEPLSLYDFLSPSSVIAKMGRNTTTALKDLEELKKISPQRIFMLYGMNDITTKANGEKFKEAYLNLIDEVKKIQPNAEITLLSILPVTDKAVAKQPVLNIENVKEYNDIIKGIAKSNKLGYMNLGGLIKDNSLYEPDGIHLKAAFYTIFLNHIKAELINR